MSRFRVKFSRSPRGFAVGEFTDFYGHGCSVQDSSLATEAALWLGVDDAEPKVLVPGKSWQPVALPEGTLFTTRMHLNVAQVRALLPVLQRFVETGSVAPKKLSKKRAREQERPGGAP